MSNRRHDEQGNVIFNDWAVSPNGTMIASCTKVGDSLELPMSCSGWTVKRFQVFEVSAPDVDGIVTVKACPV